nr:proline-rich protein 36-like [Aegilops tauschii subsp. strangulata]
MARLATAPVSPPSRPVPVLSAPVARVSPLRPFIASFGSSSLCVRVTLPLRRPTPALAGGGSLVPTAEAPPADRGETLRLAPPRRPLGLDPAGRGILGRGPAHLPSAPVGLPSPRLGLPELAGPPRCPRPTQSAGTIWFPRGCPVAPSLPPFPRRHACSPPPTASLSPPALLPAVPSCVLDLASLPAAAVCHA